MRSNTTAEDVLHTPCLEILWPRSAHSALAKHFLCVERSAPKPAPGDSSVELALTRKESAWEWDTETVEFYNEEGESDSAETRKDLILSESKTDTLSSNVETIISICQSLGIPADIREQLYDGSERFIEVRPLSGARALSERRHALGETKERSESEPRIDLEEALNLALESADIESMREALRQELSQARFDAPFEQSLAAFEQQWPGDSFERACSVFRAGFPLFRFSFERPSYAPDELIFDSLDARSADGLSAWSLFLNNSRCDWDRALGSTRHLLARAAESGNPQAEAVLIEALSQWAMDRGQGSVQGARLLCESLCSRFDRGLDTDFSGPVGAFLKRPEPSGAQRLGDQERSAFEALALRAQTLPGAQKRRQEKPEAGRAALRV